MKSSMFGLGLSFSGNLATEVSLRRELTLNDSVRANKKLGSLKFSANGRNIVCQQLPTLLDVTCFVCLCTLLHVVGSCCTKFETGQTFSKVQKKATTPNICGSCWQQCCVRLQGASDPTTRRQQQRHLKCEFAFVQSFKRLFLPTYLSSVGEPSWRWIPKDHIRVQKEK